MQAPAVRLTSDQYKAWKAEKEKLKKQVQPPPHLQDTEGVGALLLSVFAQRVTRRLRVADIVPDAHIVADPLPHTRLWRPYERTVCRRKTKPRPSESARLLRGRPR